MIQILAKPVAQKIQEEVRERTRKFIHSYHRAPRLAVVLVGTDPASEIYTRKKGEMAIALGMEHESIVLSATSTPDEVKARINALNQDPAVDGILLQRPLPKGFVESEILYWITPEKDVDAFHPLHAGELFLGLPTFQPCTPAGVMALLAHYNLPVAGKIACVIGRSSIVGKPMAALLIQADATVLHCHSKTPNLAQITQQADILIVAVGKPGLIDRRYVSPGAIVVDVGVHRNAQGQLVGDVQYDDVVPVVSAITPVPGGVGPMTIAILMQNTLRAAELRSR